jgi:glutamate/tyrosine decarboxylase-like PLP-dependent enzyme
MAERSYDCGLAFIRDPYSLPAVMAITSEYLPTETEYRNPANFKPEHHAARAASKSGAALRSLGHRRKLAADSFRS